jgi:hypothetical protein
MFEFEVFEIKKKHLLRLNVRGAFFILKEELLRNTSCPGSGLS